MKVLKSELKSGIARFVIRSSMLFVYIIFFLPFQTIYYDRCWGCFLFGSGKCEFRSERSERYHLRRWRYIVFDSSLYLKQVLCSLPDCSCYSIICRFCREDSGRCPTREWTNRSTTESNWRRGEVFHTVALFYFLVLLSLYFSKSKCHS